MPRIVNRPDFQHIVDGDAVTYVDKKGDYSIVDQVNIDDNGHMNSAMESKYLDITKEATTRKMMSAAKKKKLGIKKRDYIYHWKTTNKSFLNLYKDLCNLGIENNKFFLKLYDKDLELVNPFQAGLPLEIQLKIIFECIRNPWYFLREVCRIPEDGKPIEPGGGCQYIIDRNNCAVWYCVLNGIDVYDSKPRQTGKTQNALAICNYAYHFGTQSTEIAFFNKKTEDAQMNLARMKSQRDMLPSYMHMKCAFVASEFDDEIRQLPETNNVKTMINPVNSNKIKTFPRATTKEGAMSLGRGNTCAMMLSDEFDFQKYNLEIINSSAPAYSRASENAENNGAMHARIFTSTPQICAA